MTSLLEKLIVDRPVTLDHLPNQQQLKTIDKKHFLLDKLFTFSLTRAGRERTTKTTEVVITFFLAPHFQVHSWSIASSYQLSRLEESQKTGNKKRTRKQTRLVAIALSFPTDLFIVCTS